MAVNAYLEVQSYPPRCRAEVYRKTAERISYYQRRNRASRQAARRATLRRLHQLGITLGSLKPCKAQRLVAQAAL